MSKTLRMPRRTVEHAVRTPPEKATIPLTQAEEESRVRVSAIALAMAKAKEEQEART